MRDHLFVSYAGEDAVLARWLTLKLTAEGYRVWCDQFKLLGGESYPEDIDDAIKNKTFRMIALLSRHSIHKPNPRKERTLALNLASERGIDFVIPLNVDGLSPTELDWMTGDITFIPFHRNWAEGLAQLLKKLRAIDAPRPLANEGARIAAGTFLDDGEVLTREPEVLYTNELRFLKIPEAILRFSAATAVPKHLREELAVRWPFYSVGDKTFLAFQPPPAELPGDLRLKSDENSVRSCDVINGIPTRNIVTHLLKRSLVQRCLRKGLRLVPDHPETCYFPEGLLPADKVYFRTYTGKVTFVRAVGKRSVRRRTGERTSYRYHLACTFRVYRDAEGHKAQVRLRIHLPGIAAAYIPSRRKRISRGWWNREWLNRHLAVYSFLADGQETITIGDGEHAVLLSAAPIQLATPVGIDETRLGRVKVDEIVVIEEEQEEPPVAHQPELPLQANEEEGSMGESVIVFDEPELAFRHGQRLADPHDGLGLFGPHEADLPSHPQGVHYALVGTPEGIRKFGAFSARLTGPIFPVDGEDSRLWPPFPGFEAAFQSRWPVAPVWSHEIDESALRDALTKRDGKERAFSVVSLFMEAIERTAKRDERCDVIVCVVPEDVSRYCRPSSTVPDAVGPPLGKRERALRAAGHLSLLEQFDPNQYRYSPDFRRQIKARSMQHGIPVQIVRDSALWLQDRSLAPDRRPLTTLCDRAWNIGTALYYKAGGRPWKLAGAREGVCYIGIAFRKADEDQGNRTACCAAQMFLDSGDGIVFLGEYGPWYSPERRECHLSRESARRLLVGVLRTYRELEGKPLREVFLHSSSEIDLEEFEGYREACPSGVKLVGVRVRTDWRGTKLFRPGRRPVLRGTFRQVGRWKGFLWASGFKPRLRTYDGWETPVPLDIHVQHGDADLEQVARDIFALTKLNYNACRLGDSKPVTIKFSDAVGEILVSNPATTKPQHRFKFYI